MHLAILSAKVSAAYICLTLSTNLSKVACNTDTNQSNRSGYTLLVKEVSKTYVTVDNKLEDIYCESGALWIKGRDDLKIICCVYSFKAHQRGITSSEYLRLIDSR